MEELRENQAEENRRPRRFGRGIYDSKDVPIRLLDRFIAGIIAVIVIMIIVFALLGGYTVSFDTKSDTVIPSQKLRYGNLIEEPEQPIRQGYEFVGWYCEGTSEKSWNFAEDKVGGEMTLIADWKPSAVTVKFDAAGGVMPKDWKSETKVIYQEKYGELPIPAKEGFEFAGWVYSGNVITAESIVMMPGEHVLTASWK